MSRSPEPVLTLGPYAPWIPFGLFGLSALVFALATAVELAAVAHGPSLYDTLGPASKSAGFNLGQLTGQIEWRASAILLVGAMLAAVFSAGRVVWHALRTAWKPTVSLLVLSGAVCLIALVFMEVTSGEQATTSFQGQLVAFVERRCQAFGAGLTGLLTRVRMCGEFAAWLVGIAMACAVVVPRRLKAEDLARSIDRLRFLLYCGAAMFVLGMVTTRWTASWILTFLAPASAEPEAAREFAEFRSAAVAAGTYVAGAMYTLMLVTVYLPPAALLGRYATRLASIATEVGAEPDKVDGWLKSNDLDVSWRGQITRIAVLLAPVLSSTVVQLIGAAGG